MRVIAGTLRSRILLGPEGQSTRPITDRVKANLFNILAPRLDGAVVADCFCGTGSLGIESLSRGAACATFVEIDGGALRLLRENLETLGLVDRSRIVRQDVFRRGLPALHIQPNANRPTNDAPPDEGRDLALGTGPSASPYSLVFLDPPYRLTETAADRLWLKLDEAASAGLLSPEALVVWRFESGIELAVPEELANRLAICDRRKYGSQTLLFIEARRQILDSGPSSDAGPSI